MEFRFKSSECNSKEWVVKFNEDFEANSLKEQEYSCYSECFCSKVKEVRLNNLFVLSQDYNNDIPGEHSLNVAQNQPVFLLQVVLEGEVSLLINKSEKAGFKLMKNMYNLFYIPASVYSYKYPNKKKNILNIYFTAAFLQQKMGTDYLKSIKKYECAKNENKYCALQNHGVLLSGELRHMLTDFFNCTFEGTARQSYLESKLTEFVLMALKSAGTKPSFNGVSVENKAVLIEIEKYIQNHLKEDLTIEKLSILAGLNTSKFKRVFKQNFETSVFKYITALRIEKAIQLISKQNYTIAQASYEVGYKNPQHFTVAFKKKLGYLPSELIKQQSQNSH